MKTSSWIVWVFLLLGFFWTIMGQILNNLILKEYDEVCKIGGLLPVMVPMGLTGILLALIALTHIIEYGNNNSNDSILIKSVVWNFSLIFLLSIFLAKINNDFMLNYMQLVYAATLMYIIIGYAYSVEAKSKNIKP